MEVLKQMLRDVRRMSAKKLIGISSLAVAVAGAVTVGFVATSGTMAAGVRDTGTNPIMNKGSIGCLTKEECIADMRANNPGDLQKIYEYFNLSPSEYDRFLRDARMGHTTKSGDIIVDGQKVVTGAWSTGREKFNNQREAYTIPGAGTYYKSPTTASFAGPNIDTIVLFDENGEVEFSLLTACGNPVWGDKVKPKYSCDKLTKTPVEGKKNTYSFKVDATAVNNASIVRYEFDFGDGTKKTSDSPTIEHTYEATSSKSFTASVKVIVKLPGGKEKEVTGINCKTTVEIKVPVYACTNLVAAALDDKKQRFRFTAKMNYKDATPKSADFTADGNTTTGVTAKDNEGNFYKEYTFTDDKEHVVSVKITFEVDGKEVQTTQKCEAKVTSSKTPVCIVNGKPYPNEENPYAPNDERCREECKPGIPVGDERCNPPQECKPGVPVGSAECEERPLPETGTAGVLGLFAGTSILGAVGHRIFKSRFGRS